jgi:arsenite methyltransferase
VAVSDIALKRALPDELARSVSAHVGCVAGAVPVPDYERDLRAAGFDAVRVVDTGRDLNVYEKVENVSGCCSAAPASSDSGLPMAAECGSGASGSAVHTELAGVLSRYDVNAYAASVRVFAVKGRCNA